MKRPTIGPLWWLWLPIGILFAQLTLEIFLDDRYLNIILSENGPYELVEFVLIGAACLASLRSLVRMKLRSSPFLFCWISLAALGSFYIAGEEISWGQHFANWSTPGYWANLNDQHETNLHNVTNWLDQKPRALLETGIMIGGLLIPLLQRMKRKILPEKFDIIYPPAMLGVTAGILLFLKIADIVDDYLNTHFLERGSELQEFYIYYFMLLYMLILADRLKQNFLISNQEGKVHGQKPE